MLRNDVFENGNCFRYYFVTTERQGFAMQTVEPIEGFDLPSSHSPHRLEMAVKTLDLTPGMSVTLFASEVGRKFLAITEEQDAARIHFSYQLRGQTRVSHAHHSFALDQSNVLASFASRGAAFHMECSPGWSNIELHITAQSLFELAGAERGVECLDTSSSCCLLLNPNNAHIRDAAVRLTNLMTSVDPSALLIHSAALEFIAWNLKNLHANVSDNRICAREYRLLWLARERLLNDLSQPPTIEQLARETGLNQLKLKRGFKILFGTTAYALFQRERMERALMLLQKNSVTETASILGYSNASHFSAAFRKQFGVLPRAARRGVLG